MQQLVCVAQADPTARSAATAATSSDAPTSALVPCVSVVMASGETGNTTSTATSPRPAFCSMLCTFLQQRSVAQ